MKSSFNTKAIVLRCRDLSEADRIVTFLTPSKGKMDAVLKGAKKIAGKTIGKMEPMNLVSIMISPGRSLATVAQVELMCGFPRVRESLDKSASALYILDYINQGLEKEEENLEAFRLLLDSLTLLEEGAPTALVCRWFEMNYLKALGYLPQMEECVACGKKGEHPYMNYRKGGSICELCVDEESDDPVMKISKGALGSLRYLAKSRRNLLLRLKPSPSQMSQMKEFLSRYLEYNLPGKPVNGREYEKLAAPKE